MQAFQPLPALSVAPFVPLLVSETNEQVEQGDVESPHEPVVKETDEAENEVSSENGSEKSENIAEENSEEPQPEKPVYERTVYNFGDSEQRNKT